MRSTLHATVVTAGLLALVTTSAAIAAVPSVAQCTTPQPWAHSNAGVVVGNGTAASCTASALATAVAQGGYVTFNCGTRATSIAVNQTINISASTPTVIDGQGKITLDGRQAARIFQVQNGNALSVRNLKLQNGSSVQPASNTQYAPGTWGGGAIKVSYRGKLEVINSQFLSNRSSIGGGAIFAGSDTDVTIVKSSFSKNTSWLGGALYTQLSRLTIVNSEFVGNQAINAPAGFPDADQFGNSGAIDTDGASLAGYLNAAAGGATLSVCGTVVRNNSAANSGGGATLWAYAPDTIDVRYSTFANNIAYGGPAGGARISLGFGDTTHSGTTISTPGIINVEETSFISNRAEKSNAGALYMDCYGPSCNVSNSTFYGNYAKWCGRGDPACGLAAVQWRPGQDHGALQQRHFRREHPRVHVVRQRLRHPQQHLLFQDRAHLLQRPKQHRQQPDRVLGCGRPVPQLPHRRPRTRHQSAAGRTGRQWRPHAYPIAGGQQPGAQPRQQLPHDRPAWCCA